MSTEIRGSRKTWGILLVALGAVGVIVIYLIASGPGEPPTWMRTAETARTIMALEKDVGKTGALPLDAYKPPKPILYFQAEAGRNPLYDVHDNPLDPTGQTGFASQAHFEMLARPGGNWVRSDHLLISAGPDGIYGPVVRDATTGKLRPALPGEKDAGCDDVANFAH
jgi:hypothetical protein